MKRMAVAIAVLAMTSGCGAQVGQTELSLHQRARLPDGTWCALGGFQTSEKLSPRRVGPYKVPSDKVTVRVEIGSSARSIRASDVAVQFSYAGDGGREVRPPELSSSRNVIPAGGHAQISKTYRVESVPEIFRSRHLRVAVQMPSYPGVTFSGENP